jgi:hypothetical protein
MVPRLLPASGAGFCSGGSTVHHNTETGAPEKVALTEKKRYVEEIVCWKFELGHE